MARARAYTRAHNGSGAMQREAFRSPLKQASDPSSRFEAVVFIGIVCAGATTSSRQIASPISLGVRKCGRSWHRRRTWPKPLPDLRPLRDHRAIFWQGPLGQRLAVMSRLDSSQVCNPHVAYA
jgi:hypothetical protein